MTITKREYKEQLKESLYVIYKWSKRGLIRGQIKEKYGSTRWYANFGGFHEPWSLHDFFYPGYYYYQWPMWTWKLNELSALFFKYTGLGNLIIKWQMYCYSQAYYEVLTNFPVIDHYIDHEELIDKRLLTLYDLVRKSTKVIPNE